MYTITSVTGHVGGAAARALLAAGEPVRAVVRSSDAAQRWSDAGAETALADFTDEAALTAALAGSRGAFVMLPTIPTGSDAEHRHMADTISAAVAASAVPHVVALSSLGADLPAGTGPIRWLHHLESGLTTTGAVVSALRPPHFQEKVEAVLPAAVDEGVYPVFGDSADVATPMVATRDVGAVAAELLRTPPHRSEAIDLDAPASTEREVAEELGSLLGRALEVVTIPRDGWLGAMVEAGVPEPLAAELVAMYDADHRGVLAPRGDRRVRCGTPLDETLRAVLDASVRPTVTASSTSGPRDGQRVRT